MNSMPICNDQQDVVFSSKKLYEPIVPLLHQ